MRILSVAAFAASGYASTDGRIYKPFNPLLGETYEADYPDKGVRFISEKVLLKVAAFKWSPFTYRYQSFAYILQIWTYYTHVETCSRLKGFFS